MKASQSAFGLWGVHLNGARRLLEQPGAFCAFQSSSKLRARLAMLVWYVQMTLANRIE